MSTEKLDNREIVDICRSYDDRFKDGVITYDKGVLVAGLTFPVGPMGDETIRFQINACHTEEDIDCVL